VSAPRVPRPPLCTVIEETRRTFFTHAQDVRSNSVNSRDARMQGPQDVWSCQCQAILVEDGMIAQRSRASSLTSLPAERIIFGSGDKRDFGLSHFRGMYSRKPNFLGAGCFSKHFVLFVLFERKYCLSSGLVLYLRPQFDPPGNLSSEDFCVTARKDPLALIHNVLVFELWILLLELSITSQQCSHLMASILPTYRIRVGGAVSIFE
jgi:hypothetical protein